MLFRKIYFRKQNLVMKNLSLRRQHKLKRNIQDNHSVSFSVSSSVSVRSTIHVYCVKFISLMTMHTKCFFSNFMSFKGTHFTNQYRHHS